MNNTNDKFIVGVVGTQNTGKSTFIHDLIERYRGTDSEFRMVGCDYRKKVEEAGLQINRNGNLECQKIIFDTLVEQLNIINGSESGNYITDRSPIDAYVYTVYLQRHNPELGITDSDIEEMFNKMAEVVKTYDVIVYIDLDKCGNVVVVDDRFRDTNLEYRREIDSLFKETFAMLGETASSRLVSDIVGSRDERVGIFDRTMKGRMIAQ